MSAETARDKMRRMIAGRTTAQLVEQLDLLEGMESTPETRLVRAYTSDELENRHGLDSIMDRIFSDEDYAGTYTEAIKAALQEVGALQTT